MKFLKLILRLLFILIIEPVRKKSLRKKYDKFREDNQIVHDKIDSEYSHRHVEVNGLRWHYVEYGSKDGPVILFLHGFPECWYSWRYVMKFVNSRYRMIILDMKGFGRSFGGDGNYNWHVVAKQIVDLMNVIEVSKFYVVGHDWGSLIGSVLVHDHQDRILGFVRMEADYVPGNFNELKSYRKKPQWLIFQMTWFARLFIQNVEWFIKQVYVNKHPTKLSDEDYEYLLYEFSRPEAIYQVPLYFKKSNWDLDTALFKFCKNNYNFPVMALQADNDAAQPASSFCNSDKECPNVELKWISESGHFSNFDQSDKVGKIINDFIKRNSNE